MDFAQAGLVQPEEKQQTANNSWQIISPDNTGSTTTDDTVNNNNNDNKDDDDGNNNVRNSNVSGDQINAKFHEYELIENQLATLQAQGLKAKKSIVNDEKQLKRQIKQSVKNKNEEDTDTDDYKDLSSTTNSDPTSINNMMMTNDIGIIYANKQMVWYKNTTIIAGIVGIGIVSFVIYKLYFSKSNTNQQFRWLQNRNNNNNNH